MGYRADYILRCDMDCRAGSVCRQVQKTDRRRELNGYEEHQLKTIVSAEEFYPFTADCLPKVPGSRILDLGCGTGLELGYYFDIVPTAEMLE